MSTNRANHPNWPHVWLHVPAGIALMAAVVLSAPVTAQGLDSETAIHSIIGSEVQTSEVSIGDASDVVVAAIKNGRETTQEVRRRFNLGEVGIIHLTDAETAEAETVVETLKESTTEIQDLRIAIEGSAMFYHAINSRRIQLSDVVALQFDGDDVLIFVMADEFQ